MNTLTLLLLGLVLIYAVVSVFLAWRSSGIKPGTKFEDLPDDWICPECGVPKTMFDKI